MSKIQRYGGIKVNWIEVLDINKDIFLFIFFLIHLRKWSSDTKLDVMNMLICNTLICGGVYFAIRGFYVTHVISIVCNGSVNLSFS
jgi:hypothetical protein